MSTEAPYGSWTSPITAGLIVQASVSLGGPAFSAGDLWWSELRPTEAGRVQIVRKALDAAPSTARDVLPDGFSARTRVHEYGGGAWWLHDDSLFFSNWTDQRVWRIDQAGTDDASEPVAITPEPAEKHGFRFADGEVTADGDWVVCVREWHGAPGASEARNEIVAFRADGSSDATVLVGGERGPDFVSSPRVHPDGSKLCWIQWNHPDMPWDTTELWVADVDWGSVVATPTIDNAVVIGSDEPESGEDFEWKPGRAWMQPRWVGENDQLWVLTDPYDSVRREGEWETRDWWGLQAYKHFEGEWRAINQVFAPAEAGEPAWVFGQSSYCIAKASANTNAVTPHGLVSGYVVWHQDGVDRVGFFTSDYRSFSGGARHTSVSGLTPVRKLHVAAIAASFTTEPEIVLLGGASDDLAEIQRPARDLGIDADAWFSVPDHLTFPTTPNADGSDAVAHALFYPPKNPDHHGPADHAPPLIVMSHGGPTSAARPQLNLSIQFWTSRGFAVVDVNYRGSVGYGRAYREALNDRWGIADVDDCIAAARFLAADGRVDGDRLAIRGGSAGGFTTLCALTFHDDFTAGCSLYGVADLEALAKDTHKFESRYLDRLVGPYPEAKATYDERSPIHHTDQLATPLIILQGLEDEVVPPAQAEMMVDALRAKQVPFAYVAFEGEQHGFRQAPNIQRALEAELYFYSRVFGFDLVDDIDPVPIEFL